MWTNATITIARRGTTYSQTTGDRTSASGTTILTAADCLFSQVRQSGRNRYTEGQREFSQTVPGVLIPNQTSIVIKVGDQAVLVCEGITESYTVNHAVLTKGITESHWELELDSAIEGQQ